MAHFVNREERIILAPWEEPFEMITFEQIGKPSDHHHQDFADDKYHGNFFQNQRSHNVGHKGPYLQATVVRHQQPCVAYNGPYVQTRFAPKVHIQGSITHHQVENYQQAKVGTSQVPQVMKKRGVIDCNEAAKLYGGVVFTDYGTNNKYL